MTTAPPGGPDERPTPRSDTEVEAVLTHHTGRPVPAHLEQDALAVGQLRHSLTAVAPTPNAELARLLREGARRRPRTRLVGAAGWFVGLGMGAQLGLASAAAAAGLVAAGSAHVLPGPVQDAYDSVAALLQPEDDGQGSGLPDQVGQGVGGGDGGASTADLAPDATSPDTDPDRARTGSLGDAGEGSTSGPGPSHDGAGGQGAGAQPTGAPSAPGPAAAGGGGAGPSGPGGTHSQPDDEDDEDAAEEAADGAADAAEDAADQAEDAHDEAQDAEEEAAEDAEDAAEDAEADDEREQGGE